MSLTGLLKGLWVMGYVLVRFCQLDTGLPGRREPEELSPSECPVGMLVWHLTNC